MAIYDDTNKKITLSADELNNYSFNSLNNYISSTLYGNGHITSILTSISYNLATYSVDEDIIQQNASYFSYVNGSNYVMFNFDIDEPNNKFAYVEANNPIDFESDITLNVEQQYYDDVKQAIEADIAANQPDPEPQKEPVSETPATLVADGEYIGEKLQINTFNVGGDLISTKDIGAIWGKLSPNPAGFGFVRQEFVDFLPVTGVPRVLYLLKVYDKEVLAGYVPYFWNQENLSFERLKNNNIPNFRAEKGEHKQSNQTAIENTEPREVDPYAQIVERVKKEDEADSYKEVVGLVNKGIKNGDVNIDYIDDDVTVEIENNYSSDDYANRTNYDAPISLKQFIANCEAGNVYTNDGIIAKINNLLDEHTFRLILIGRNHDTLAYDDTTVAKTTWQFLDQPEHQVRLGLPFNVIDWGSNMGRAYANAYLDGTNVDALTWYPSNRGGLVTAQGLLNCLHTIFEGLPLTLRRAIKTVRKAFNIPRQYRSIAASGGTETDSSATGYLAQKLFHLTATELGSTSYGTEGTAYSYLNSSARRIRFYNGTAAAFWAATPNPSYSYFWVFVDSGGAIYPIDANYGIGVAPAFCI